MSPEEIDKHINKIAWGARYLIVKNGYDRDVVIILKTLSLQDRNFLDFIFEKAKQDGKNLGVFTKIELINEYQRRQIWTDKDEKILEDTKKAVKSLYDEEKTVNKSKAKKIKRAIKLAEKNLEELITKKTGLFSNCVENYAEEQKLLAFVYCCTNNEENKKMWGTWKDFTDCLDTILIRNILIAMNNDTMLSTKTMRKIARSAHWRFRWNAAKNIGDLFGKPIMELDTEQQSLLYWSQVYDSAYESYERPSREIIEDDDALDKWFEEQDKKDKAKELEKGSKVGKIKVNEKVMKHGEIFIVTNPEINPDTKYRQKPPNIPSISDVENLNDAITKKFKEKELEKIKEKGMIQEKELRHRKNKIARELIGSKAAILKPNKMSGHARGNKSKIVPGQDIS